MEMFFQKTKAKCKMRLSQSFLNWCLVTRRRVSTLKVVIIFITSIMISIENVPCRCYTDVADMKFDRRPFLFSAKVFVIFVVTIRGVHSQDFVRGDGIVPDDVQDNSCPYTDTVNDFSECTLDFWKVKLSVIYFFIVM